MKKISIGVLIVVIFDIIIKLIISFNFHLNQSIMIIKNFFYLTYVQNNGAAWSSFSGQRLFLIFITIFVIIAIIYYIYKNPMKSKLLNISYILILGGAIGNLIDRLIYGYVIDYLDFYLLSYNFPVFNLADSCIVIGAILFLIGGINHENN